MHDASPTSPSPRRRLVRAAMVVDGATIDAAPGVVLLEGDRILAAGPPAEIGAPAADVEVVDRTGDVLTPPFVNAHAHLDLSAIGPLPLPAGDAGGFDRWLEAVRAARPTDDEAIAGAVALGAERSIAGGVGAVGDVAGAGHPAAVDALRVSPLWGTSYLEVFGIGDRAAATIARIPGLAVSRPGFEGGVRLGLSPHAPYSCSPEVFRAAADTGLPLSTHLAETPEEIAFVRSGAGPLAAMLARFGIGGLPPEGWGRSPIELVAGALGGRPCLAAHVNVAGEDDLRRLAEAGITVAYCPRASAFFGRPGPGEAPHRYRQMLSAGVRVALGTDGAPCLETPDRIGVLDDARLLRRRDGTDARTLLAMATIHGAVGIGLDPQFVTLGPGRPLGILAHPIAFGAGASGPGAPGPARAAPLERVLAGDAAPTWLLGPREPA